MAKRDTWDPAQYGKFAAERARPFEDLLALVNPTRAAGSSSVSSTSAAAPGS